MTQIEALPQTTIAAIHSACAGGGTELALACDLRFAAEGLAAEGTKIGLPETTIGILPGWGGTVRATQLLGGAIARRLILTGELISATEALRIGLVDGVFIAEQFRYQIEKVIEQVLKCGPQARRRVKYLLQQHVSPGTDLASQYEAEARAFAECYSTGEPIEGQTAFLEKRAAKWVLL
jgi:enoyl-CoA hydratase/carnithine racemase